jgi:AcrR family transcriptional regulator
MRKSEHTELASLTRLAVHASSHGLSSLSYANAASTAHTSKGALQRVFPSKLALQLAILHHAVALLTAHLFGVADVRKPLLDAQAARTLVARWADWISGDAGLPGGCVLLNCSIARGYPSEITASAGAALEALVRRLSEQLGTPAATLLGAALNLDLAQHLQGKPSTAAANKAAFEAFIWATRTQQNGAMNAPF